jgi:hypothetical protein
VRGQLLELRQPRLQDLWLLAGGQLGKLAELQQCHRKLPLQAGISAITLVSQKQFPASLTLRMKTLQCLSLGNVKGMTISCPSTVAHLSRALKTKAEAVAGAGAEAENTELFLGRGLFTSVTCVLYYKCFTIAIIAIVSCNSTWSVKYDHNLRS